MILFDDVGFSDLGCYGSAIRTTAIDALAARVLAYWQQVPVYEAEAAAFFGTEAALFFSSGMPSLKNFFSQVFSTDHVDFLITYFAVGSVFASIAFAMARMELRKSCLFSSAAASTLPGRARAQARQRSAGAEPRGRRAERRLQ